MTSREQVEHLCKGIIWGVYEMAVYAIKREEIQFGSNSNDNNNEWPLIEWGSEIRPFQNMVWKHLKSGLFEDHISNGLIFKGSVDSFSYSYGSSPSKTRLFLNRTIQNPEVLVQITNGFWQNVGHLSGFQMVMVRIWNFDQLLYIHFIDLRSFHSSY